MNIGQWSFRQSEKMPGYRRAEDIDKIIFDGFSIGSFYIIIPVDYQNKEKQEEKKGSIYEAFDHKTRGSVL